MNHALTCITNDKNTYMVERKETVTKAESDRIELFALKKKKIDMEGYEIRSCWHECNATRIFSNLQKEIYKASKSTASSTSLSPSTRFGGVAV